MIKAQLKFKKQFETRSSNVISIQSQNYRNASKVVQFEDVYIDPFSIYIRSCGCIYEKNPLNIAVLCVIDWTLKTHFELHNMLMTLSRLEIRNPR